MAYARLHDLKSYLGIDYDVTGDDVLLESLLTRTSAAIDAHCGRTFEAATDTRYFSSDALDRDGHTLIVDKDLISITTLTNGDDDATAIASTEYWLVPRNEGPPYYGIRLKSDSASIWQWDTDGWVSVVGSWGFATEPPAPIVQACIRWASHMYHQKDAPVYETTAFPEAGVITAPVGIPVDVERLLQPYRRR